MDANVRYLKHLMPGVTFIFKKPDQVIVHQGKGRIVTRRQFTARRVQDLADTLLAMLTPHGGTVILYHPNRFSSTEPLTIELGFWQRFDLLKGTEDHAHPT